MSIGGVGADGVFDIATDAAGNSYVAGYFSGTVDFDSSRTPAGENDTLSARGAHDAFFAKYAPDNALLWVRRMGGDELSPSGMFTDVARDVTIDNAGNAYVIGEFSGTGDFGESLLTSAGGRDVFITKIDSNGNFQWSSRWGGTSSETGHSVEADASGNVYALSGGGSGYQVRKFTGSGLPKWTVAVPGQSSTADMAVSQAGDAYIVGTFYGTVDFDPSAKTKNVSSGSGNAGFVLKLDGNGKFGWVTPFTGRIVGSNVGTSAATEVALDGNGNVIVAGNYRGTVDFDPGTATTLLETAGGAFVTKLNSSGGLVWARALTAMGSSVAAYALDADTKGNVYVTGAFDGSIDLDPGSAVDLRSSNGDRDIYVAKLTATGSLVWGETFGGIGSDIGWGIDVDNAGNVCLAGYFSDEVDFDPDPLGTKVLGALAAARDGFFLRLGQGT